MGYQITLIYADGDEASTNMGELLLPGEPITYHLDATCGICDHPIDAYDDPRTGDTVRHDVSMGDHEGIIAEHFSPGPGCPVMVMGYMHLRCFMDLTDQGLAGFITQGAEYSGTGRHAEV